ncbi:M1 family metallopeptidase [Salegentibacter salarius]|uniref:Aminopeptidase N n=1 Tax=Salegentibacter salarius TaxID=435906 RepID=A0A2N0U0H2_9FLAO|nr:M1 family metallopeptidase [Salegentibacter salarius]OEY73453.1 aminopeptidase [Salegentibacter salarius]PKD20491.1 aminopeptidase [Salegentibacter salarius]SLJ96243.1 aminopeptidase N [Salegentibacter salarius]
MRYPLIILFFCFGWNTYSQAPLADSLDQINSIDFKKAEAEIRVIPEEKQVSGTIEYNFQILKSIDSFYVDARNMNFDEVLLNEKSVAFRNTDQRIWIKNELSPSENNSLQLKYSVEPKKAVYFINWELPDSIDAPKQVWTQGQGRYTSNWLPSFDDQREKVEFDISYQFPQNLEVMANGELIATSSNDSLKNWSFDMQRPMSSYLLAFAAGNYLMEETESSSGVALQFYMPVSEKANLEPTYRHTKTIFDFLENEIGVAYPWQNYKQAPVRDFLYSGMENTTATIFDHAFITDSIAFKDRNYVSVNAHEMAHQWFGNLVTAETANDHWLHEGFATFYALLAEREIFGDDYYYWKLYQSAEQLKELSDQGKGEPVTKANASSLTYYHKGAWALHILREKVGKEAFNTAVKNYLEQYKFKTATTSNFIAEVEAAANVDLPDFIAKWLNQTAFQGFAALNSLKNSEFIKKHLEILALRETPLEKKEELLSAALDFPVSDYTGQEVVYQLADETSETAINLYKKAFKTNNIYVRQAIATSMKRIPKQLKSEFESLLDDKSYLTKEVALLKLWMNFPQKVSTYLNKTRGVAGFTNKNVRMLWLTLNLITPDYEPGKQQEIYQELSRYTATYYPIEVRENAFGYLYQINSFTNQNLLDLMQGTQHHAYRFRDYSRQLLDELLKKEEYRQKFLALDDRLSQKEQDYLQTKL